MTRKFETEKHFKKRHNHLIGHDQLKPQEKMASIKKEELSAMNEKTESANKIIESAKQPVEIKPAASTSAAAIAPTPPPTPVMAQQIFQFEKKKNAFEKLNDKFHQLIDRFK